jgi:hypothetical protein
VLIDVGTVGTTPNVAIQKYLKGAKVSFWGAKRPFGDRCLKRDNFEPCASACSAESNSYLDSDAAISVSLLIRGKLVDTL